MATLWVEGVTNKNDTLLCLILYYSEKKHQLARIRITAYQQQIQAAHPKKVRSREFQVGDLVLTCVIQSSQQKDHRKLEPNWECPYINTARGGNGSYALADQEGNQLKLLNKQ